MNKLAWLPNKDGFQFIGVSISEELEPCIIRNVMGVHKVYSEKTGEAFFDKLKGWEMKNV